MTLSEIDVDSTLERAKKLAAADKTLPESVRSLIGLLVVIVGLLLRRLNVNSRNSSVPPSKDPLRERGSKVTVPAQRKRKPGG